MRVLALDTATEACSVALSLDGREITRRSEGSRGHAERILALIDEVLAEGGIALTRLDGIVASVGPGAFTGVRISVAVAQGLAFGAGLPVVPVMTLEALAFERLERASACDVALSCLDARMGEVYWACHALDARRGLEGVAAARVSAPEEIGTALGAVRATLDPRGRLLGIGRGFQAYPALAALPGVVLEDADARALPDARAMARLGIIRLAAGEGIDPAMLEPVYLRDRVALTEAERAR